MFRETVKHVVLPVLYFMLYQFVFSFVCYMAATGYAVCTGGVSVDEILNLVSNGASMTSLMGNYTTDAMAWGLLLSSLATMWHLTHFGYFNFGKQPLNKVKGGVMALSVVLVFLAMLVFNIIAQWAGLPDEMEVQMNALSKNVVGVLAIAVAGPILEEMLFRGAIQGYLMRKFSNPWVGILAASLVFGLIHVNPIQVFYATMLGIVFGWIYYRTGNLMPVVIGHVLNNSLAAMMMYFGLDAEEKALSASSEITLLLVSSVAAVVTAWLINRIQQDIIPWYDATDEQQATE